MTFDADRVRSTFTEYFTERGHVFVPSAGLIPHHPHAPMFTNAGMVPFIPYFTGEETPPFARATSVQKCVRIRGKHDDIELIGRTTRHGSFFEMLGNWSFGDYFKHDAIAYAWEFLTDRLGLDPEKLWVTVHIDDEEAERIWIDEIGFPPERIQRMGEDNFWEMGETGPCGPSSEIHFDRGPEHGADGGPDGGGEDRFLEIWNLVFMQYRRLADGSLEDLPAHNIDTGAGLERLITVIEGAASVWETSCLAPLVDEASRSTGVEIGRDVETDVALRVIADHSRTMTFLIGDGVFPSNEGRGYVLRRIIRRAVLKAQQVSERTSVLPAVVEKVVDMMKGAYPALSRDRDLITTVVTREEEAFRRTLRQGSALLETELAAGTTIPGSVAFRLHDTFGFPIDLTVEIAGDRGIDVDRDGFEAEMAEQRTRARGARKANATADLDEWRAILDEFGPTEFTGYHELESESRVLAVLEREEAGFVGSAGAVAPDGAALINVVLQRTPFYAEGGGQVGDTGTITGPNGTVRVLDTKAVVEGLVRHTGYVTAGEIEAGEVVTGTVDAERRAAIRRNHTATHILQAALRRVLGSHVGQQGSLVEPDRLRFDFSHFAAMTPEEIEQVEDIVNDAVLENSPVRTYETSRAEAEEHGAIAFFGERYGEVVRVVEAGDVSVELCGGTHVHATGTIGPFRITSESSVGANTRRIFATTGKATIAEFRRQEHLLDAAAEALHTPADEVVEAVERVIAERKRLDEDLRRQQQADLGSVAKELADSATSGAVAARRDGLDPAMLRELALAVRDQAGVPVGIVGSPDGTKVALVVATVSGGPIDARVVAAEVAKIVGGGGGGSPELATAGGRDVGAIDAAAERLGALLHGG